MYLLSHSAVNNATSYALKIHVSQPPCGFPPPGSLGQYSVRQSIKSSSHSFRSVRFSALTLAADYTTVRHPFCCTIYLMTKAYGKVAAVHLGT